MTSPLAARHVRPPLSISVRLLTHAVSASCLFKKPHSIGIRGSLLRWLHSYVMGRQHRTVVDGETSSWLPCSLIREATRVYPGAAIIRYLH